MCFDSLREFNGDVLILSGDVPLISLQTLKELEHIKSETNSKACILTADMKNPDGYGRIIRDKYGKLISMKEHKDCKDNELLITEINAGIYIIDNSCLFNYIPKINNENVQGEYYLPDLINLMMHDKLLVSTHKTSNTIEISGVNNKNQLCELESYLEAKEKN